MERKMRTSEEYISKLHSMESNIFLGGRAVGRDHSDFIPGLNVISLTFDLAQIPDYAELMTVAVDGENINRFNYIPQNADDLIKKIEMVRKCCQKTGGCIQRCMGNDSLIALSAVTRMMDDKLGTEYQKRLADYLGYFRENDLVGSVAMTDGKGDRSLRPHQQSDPDLYLRIADKNNDGIIVKGAKAHNTISPYSDELIVLPTRALKENEDIVKELAGIPRD
jgi:4-hydroxyphenylacetate 3-monooxygenase/4-hydroxybutyryl-CoA dehydratase/vinylacetyl-CoA-Delta-isomerase